MFDPTLLATFFAGLSAVIIAYVWYLPSLFGTAWIRMSGITPEMAERGKKRMPLMILFGLLSAMLVAYVMSYVSSAWGFYDWIGAVELGFWCWVGFVAPTMLGMVLWEQKPFSLYLINVLYWLVAMLVMAQIVVAAAALNPTYSNATPLSGEYAGE